MKQAVRLNSWILAGVGTSALIWISSKPNREKAMTMLRRWTGIGKAKREITLEEAFPIEKAGHPDPHDIGDNNMVSEGALYSVKYYNKEIQ
ncbi:hypothetical protein ACFOU2_20395 [Bacillus songklensis]|uniref:Uncharacterized protein n=1 Tax=Bacillus songklensis TaxID=1069116 RepID=A0ABV8B5W6_9BACI